MKLRLLIVEDDPNLGELISHYFMRKDWETVIATDGDEALEKFNEENFQLILLDIMLPKQDGFTVCRKIRENSDIPIFFITARVIEEDELRGYALGADDYITKPFSLPVLFAKATSMMNRVRGGEISHKIKRGNIEVDIRNHVVSINGKISHLPTMEYNMLLFFLENPNRIFSRDQLIVRFWGYDFDGNERVVDNHIRKLRKAIVGSDCKIQTIHKTGYRLEVSI